MEEQIYNFAMVMIWVAVIAFLLGLAQPPFLKKLLPGKVRVRNFAQLAASLFILSVVLTSIFEPAHVTQSRLDKQAQMQTEKQEKQDTINAEQQDLTQQVIEGSGADGIASRAQPNQNGQGQPVKKAQNGACYGLDSKHYKRITDYKPYQSMEACLKSGGRQANN